MADFHFLRPAWFLALLPLAWTLWRLYRRGSRNGDWARLCDSALLPHLLVTDRVGGPARLALGLYGLGGLLAILALAGPVWERLPAPAFRNDSALVIALDLSRSMDAADIKPSRLERARYKVVDILKQRKDGITALLVYSGDAFTVTPLTDDGETIHAQLTALSSDLMPAQGSRADLALDLAGRLLKQAGITRGDVLLITSGVNLTKAEPAAQRLAAQGYRLSVLGAGGMEGAPIPLPEGGFLEDPQGSIVISKLAEPALRQLANRGGGRYRGLTSDNADLSALLPFFAEATKEEGSRGESQTRIERWEERGPWLLLLLLPVAALAFRRGYLAAVALILVMPIPQPAHALDWQDLWRTPDQQALQAFESGDPTQAAEKFRRPDWKAAAQYKAGRFEEAARILASRDDPEAQYNLGNALARMGRYQEAIQAYDRALIKSPGHEDARYNKELVEKALEEQAQKNRQDKQGDKDKEEGKDGSDRGRPQEGQPSAAKQSPEADQEGQDKSRDENTARDSSAQQKGEGGQEEPGRKNDSGQARKEKSKEQETGNSGPGQNREQGRQDSLYSADTAREGEGRPTEEQQATEQWLRRIPDDPGGLLKRKFYYQYQQRQGQSRSRQP